MTIQHDQDDTVDERERDFFRSILDNLYHVSVMVADTEPRGAIRFANRFFCDHCGVDPDQALSMNVYDFVSAPDDDITKIDQAIGRTLAGEGPVKVEGYFRSKEKGRESRALGGLMIVQRLDLPEGSPLLIFTTLDIGALGLHLRPGQESAILADEQGWVAPPTLERGADADAARERDFYRAILDALGAISVMVADSEPVGAVRFGNEYFCEHNGVAYEQAITMNAYDFAPTPDDDIAKINDAIGRVMAGERAVMVHGYFRSKRAPRSFWGLIIVRRLDRPGASPCLTFVTIDLTMLGLLAETTLMTAEQVRAITTATQDGVVLVDKIGTILYWNIMAERMTGVMAGSAVGKRLCDLAVPEEERGGFRESLGRRLDESDAADIAPFESVLAGPTGEPFPVEVSASRVRQEDGRWGGVLFIRDITRRKESERKLLDALEEARQAERLKGQFVTLVSHDLRSPLSGVVGALRLAAGMLDGDAPPSVRDLLDRSTTTCESLLTMIDTLLDLSRLKSGRVVPRPRSADAYGYLTESVAGLRGVAEGKGVELSVKAPFGLRFFVDADLFAQVVYNLVANAIKFTGRGGRVTVSIRENEPQTVFIRDTGVGIHPHRLRTLFDADKAESTNGTEGERGHGFGLSLCAELMRIQGGDLSVESRQGEGSLFTCHLPENHPVVLVVDDTPLDRLTVIGRLAETGANFIEAEDGEQALTLLRDNAPHVALVDLQMPCVDGLALLERLRANPSTATLPVIVMTADRDIDIRRKAFALGADDFVVKPIVPDDFLPRVLRYLSLADVGSRTPKG